MPDKDDNYNKRIKNPCKVCHETVTQKTGLRCEGACKKWTHFKCLNYSPQKIQDIQDKIIKIRCPCPNCDTKSKHQEIQANYCGKDQCPAVSKFEWNANKGQAIQNPTPGGPRLVYPRDCGSTDGELRSFSSGLLSNLAGKPVEMTPRPYQQCHRARALNGQTPTKLPSSPLPQFNFEDDLKLNHNQKNEKTIHGNVKSHSQDQSNQSSDTLETTRKTTRSVFTKTPSTVMRDFNPHLDTEQCARRKRKEERMKLKTSSVDYGCQAKDSCCTATERHRCGTDYSLGCMYEGDAKSSSSLPSMGPLDLKEPMEITAVNHCKSDLAMSLSFITRNNVNAILEQMCETMGLLHNQFQKFIQNMVNVVNSYEH